MKDSTVEMVDCTIPVEVKVGDRTITFRVKIHDVLLEEGKCDFCDRTTDDAEICEVFLEIIEIKEGSTLVDTNDPDVVSAAGKLHEQQKVGVQYCPDHMIMAQPQEFASKKQESRAPDCVAELFLFILHQNVVHHKF